MTAPVIGRLKRFDLPRVIEVRVGWAHVLYVPPQGSTAKQYDGWIPATADHLSPSVLDLAIRSGTAKESSWPVSVQNDVALGRVRLGFTRAQVKAANSSLGNLSGDPLTKRSVESATGIREAWVYPGRVIRFAGDRVVAIETNE